jgi:hypothetical protein
MHVEAVVDVAYHLVRLTEVDGNVSLFQLFDAFFPFLGIVDGDDDFMLTGEGGFLYLMAHLSISNYCNFHD